MKAIVNTTILAYLLFCSVLSFADVETARRYVPDADLAGKTRMKFMLWNVYDAALYTPEGRWEPEQPFALSLTYLRKLSGKDIAKRSIKEIRKQGFNDEPTLNRWYESLVNIFPDVNKSMNITGVRDSDAHTHFYRDGRYIASIRETLFTEWFFNIWLGENTSVPKFRDNLIKAKS